MKRQKIFVINIWLSIFIVLLSSCKNYNHVYKDNLSGKVKSVELEIYDADEVDGIIQKDGLESKHIMTYDKNGFRSQYKEYDGSNNLKYSFTVKRDKSKIETEYNRPDETSKTIVELKDNLPTSIKSYKKGILIQDTKFFTEDNKTILGITRNKKNEITIRNIEEYKNGNVIKSIVLFDEIDLEKYTYFDLNTYKITEILQKNNGSEYRFSLKYDELGLIVESVNGFFDEYKGGESSNSTEKYTYKYELDNKNNWIKCIVYEEGSNKPVFIKERKITYY